MILVHKLLNCWQLITIHHLNGHACKVFNHYENVVLKIIESIENIKSSTTSRQKKFLYLSVGALYFGLINFSLNHKIQLTIRVIDCIIFVYMENYTCYLLHK